MGPLGPCVAVFVFGVVVILWVWKNVEPWVVMRDPFEVPKIVMSNCGVGIVAGAINVMDNTTCNGLRKQFFALVYVFWIPFALYLFMTHAPTLK